MEIYQTIDQFAFLVPVLALLLTDRDLGGKNLRILQPGGDEGEDMGVRPIGTVESWCVDYDEMSIICF
jgi:hypothetical protein